MGGDGSLSVGCVLRVEWPPQGHETSTRHPVATGRVPPLVWECGRPVAGAPGVDSSGSVPGAIRMNDPRLEIKIGRSLHDDRNGPNPENCDAQLLQELDAFYEEWFRRLYAFIRRRVPDRTEAEDLTQEVFAAAIASLGRFERRAQMESWLFGIARNVVLTHRRSRARRRAHAEAFLFEASLGDSPSTPEETARGRRALEVLRRELSTVEDWSARAFRLRWMEGLPLREVARRTARSRHAVRASLEEMRRRVVQNLRA